MNCKETQEELALAAAGALESARQREVSEHCRQCPTCATQLLEWQRVCSAQAGAAGEIARLPLRYRGARRMPGPLPERRSHSQKLPVSWRWLLPAAAAAIALALLVRNGAPPDQATVSPPRIAAIPAAPAPPSPSMGAYRNALSATGEASLDALLARHEMHLLPNTPHQELSELRRQL